MIDPMSLFASMLAFFVVAVSPGPATLSNATIAMAHGRAPSLRYALGLSAGLAFWGLVAASGMGAILQGSAHLLSALKIAGGLYLLWLALGNARAARKGGAPSTTVTTQSSWFRRGLLLNLSNPKSVVAWMAALAVGLDADAGAASIVVATAACTLVGLGVNAGYSLVFSLGGMMRLYLRVHRVICGTMAALFAMAGVGLIRSAFAR